MIDPPVLETSQSADSVGAHHRVHVSVTALGTNSGSTRRAADQIVAYLEGDLGLEAVPAPVEVDGEPRVAGYFADSAEAPGEWVGETAVELGLRGEVDAGAFRRILLGQHPSTAEVLVSAQGSAGRTDRRPSRVPHSESLSTSEVAVLAGVDRSYVQRLLKRTESAMEGGDELEGKAFLVGWRSTDGSWRVSADEAQRFAESRRAARVVMAYDVTFSVPKSVSIIWAQGNDEVRAQVDAAVDASVRAGMDYLERHGLGVRNGGRVVKGSGLVAASYRHNTNRALEPQIHHHVVVANMTQSPRGWRAVDSRRLFAHATTAGYLGGAELRRQLSARLGVGWEEPNRGLADVLGVSRETIMSMSSRRKDVLSLAGELGFDSAKARQTAALASRPDKLGSVDAEILGRRWSALLANNGFSRDDLDKLRQHQTQPWTGLDAVRLFEFLGSPEGVTEQAAVFDRRDVIQAVAVFANNRLDAVGIERVADNWLRSDAVVALAPDRADESTAEVDGFEMTLFSTPEMVELEQRVINLHANGDLIAGVVDPLLVESAITNSPVELGADQAAMVRAITTSGEQFQAVVGRAGSGKTTAITAAAEAWQADGYRVLGAAPFGDAARKLETETGLRSWTLEGLLTRVETSPQPFLDANTVVIVDEASTIGNRQLDRLYRYASDAGSVVRTIGDPKQHQSVEAGGLWNHLTEQFPEPTPVLETNRRQVGPDMAEVRLAVDEYRAGLVSSAMRRLDGDGRVVTAGSWEELLDVMAADWLTDHRQHLAGELEPSKMVAERNSDRHALNRRAQTLLRAEGVLHSPVAIGEQEFHVGDRVVAQVRNTDLVPEGADARRHVVNGSEGTVLAITNDPADEHGGPGLRVAFDGLGTIDVPHHFVAEEVGRGRGGGLTPAYAVTSFKAEGQTFRVGRNLAAPAGVNTEGMYVALTRGRRDQRTYTIDPALNRSAFPELPIMRDDRTAVEALIDGLNKPRGTGLASAANREAKRTVRRAERERPRPGPGLR